MDVYVARQPIFDSELRLYGYELLYRESKNNFFEGKDDQTATATLLANSVLVGHFNELIDRKRGFINFPGDFLTAGLPRLLPRQKIVIEILERVQATDAVIMACRQLKKDGYTLALDDFNINNSREVRALIELADIIKIEFSKIRLVDQLKFIRSRQGKTIFLAEKIETEKEFQLAKKMGYQLFQGYFFSKPSLINAKDIGTLNGSLIRIIKALGREEPDFPGIAKVIEQDLGLSYKILRLANTVNYGTQYPVRSIQQALVRIGTMHLIQWMHLFLLNGVRNIENSELVKESMIRGKMMALLCKETGQDDKESDYFIAGIFSSIDHILDDSMEHIIDELPLDDEVKNALLGAPNAIRQTLDSVIAFEEARWDALFEFTSLHQIRSEKYMSLYLKALKWRKLIPKAPHAES